MSPDLCGSKMSLIQTSTAKTKGDQIEVSDRAAYINRGA